MNEILYKSIEIVGTDNGNDGRSCGIHIQNCGIAIEIGTKLKLVKTTIEITKTMIVTVPVDLSTNQTAIVHKKRGRPKKDDPVPTTTIEQVVTGLFPIS
jgi:hypothetical protein